VEAASVNPSDVKNVAGQMESTVLPRIPGRDFAGVVISGPPDWQGAAVWGTDGDGSIVCVPAPGHTPGSIIVFVRLPNNVRYALVGDLVWQREGLTNLEERPLLSRLWPDLDPDGTRQNILRMASIVKRIPNMIVVPAHDQRAFADMAELPNVTTKGLIL
jgi:glyoxylase-like metal-dependent hydrolase (beta-lactamase superfamily II)